MIRSSIYRATHGRSFDGGLAFVGLQWPRQTASSSGASPSIRDAGHSQYCPCDEDAAGAGLTRSTSRTKRSRAGGFVGIRTQNRARRSKQPPTPRTLARTATASPPQWPTIKGGSIRSKQGTRLGARRDIDGPAIGSGHQNRRVTTMIHALVSVTGHRDGHGRDRGRRHSAGSRSKCHAPGYVRDGETTKSGQQRATSFQELRVPNHSIRARAFARGGLDRPFEEFPQFRKALDELRKVGFVCRLPQL
jgi:hypothetical protein